MSDDAVAVAIALLNYISTNFARDELEIFGRILGVLIEHSLYGPGLEPCG